jgi:hypothetical protein
MERRNAEIHDCADVFHVNETGCSPPPKERFQARPKPRNPRCPNPWHDLSGRAGCPPVQAWRIGIGCLVASLNTSSYFQTEANKVSAGLVSTFRPPNIAH